MAIAGALAGFSAAQAQVAANAEHLTVGAGAFNVLDSGDTTAQFSGEYRGQHVWHGLRPVVGASMDADGGVYGYGGLNYDVFLGDSWVVTPNFVAGAYHKGDSKDLGHALEFRSGLEVGYVLENQARVGATFNHISNASLGDKNPGAESLMVVYSHPINVLGE